MTNTQQQGAVLPTALVMTLALTLFSLTAMQSTIFQEKMSSNSQNREIAFQSAESALREAEDWVVQQTALTAPAVQCAAQPCVLTIDTTLDYGSLTNAWWASNAASFASSGQQTGNLDGISQQPRYRVEYVGFVADDLTIGHKTPTGAHYYQATARGTGGNNDSVTIVQSTVAKRY